MFIALCSQIPRSKSKRFIVLSNVVTIAEWHESLGAIVGVGNLRPAWTFDMTPIRSFVTQVTECNIASKRSSMISRYFVSQEKSLYLIVR